MLAPLQTAIAVVAMVADKRCFGSILREENKDL
jgi:hypothetical protein